MLCLIEVYDINPANHSSHCPEWRTIQYETLLGTLITASKLLRFTAPLGNWGSWVRLHFETSIKPLTNKKRDFSKFLKLLTIMLTYVAFALFRSHVKLRTFTLVMRGKEPATPPTSQQLPSTTPYPSTLSSNNPSEECWKMSRLSKDTTQTHSARVYILMHSLYLGEMCEQLPQTLSTGEGTLVPRAILHLERNPHLTHKKPQEHTRWEV